MEDKINITKLAADGLNWITYYDHMLWTINMQVLQEHGNLALPLARINELMLLGGEHPLPDGPWIISRQALESQAAIDLVERARRSTRTPAKPAPDQKTLGFSGT